MQLEVLKLLIIIIILAQIPEILQGLGRCLSCGARGSEQSSQDLLVIGYNTFSGHVSTGSQLPAN